MWLFLQDINRAESYGKRMQKEFEREYETVGFPQYILILLLILVIIILITIIIRLVSVKTLSRPPKRATRRRTGRRVIANTSQFCQKEKTFKTGTTTRRWMSEKSQIKTKRPELNRRRKKAAQSRLFWLRRSCQVASKWAQPTILLACDNLWQFVAKCEKTERVLWTLYMWQLVKRLVQLTTKDFWCDC